MQTYTRRQEENIHFPIVTPHSNCTALACKLWNIKTRKSSHYLVILIFYLPWGSSPSAWTYGCISEKWNLTATNTRVPIITQIGENILYINRPKEKEKEVGMVMQKQKHNGEELLYSLLDEHTCLPHLVTMIKTDVHYIVSLNFFHDLRPATKEWHLLLLHWNQAYYIFRRKFIFLKNKFKYRIKTPYIV